MEELGRISDVVQIMYQIGVKAIYGAEPFDLYGTMTFNHYGTMTFNHY